MLARAAIALTTLTALLTACAGPATTGSGTRPPPSEQVQAQCPFGTAATPTGVPWQERPGGYEQSILPAAMNTRAGRIVVLQPAATVVDEPATWTFDVCRNTWHRMTATMGADADLSLLVYHAAADLTLAIPRWEGPIRAYSMASDSWTDLPTQGPQPEGISDVVYDPDTARVIGWSDSTVSLWTYDLERQAWAEVSRRDGDAWPDTTSRTIDDWTGYTLLTYDTVRDAVLLAVFPVPGRRGGTWSFDVGSGRWTDLRSTPPALLFGYVELGSEMAYDSAHGQAVSTGGGDMAVFDSHTGAWSRPSAEPWKGITEFDTTWAPGQIEGQEFMPYGLPVGPIARTGHTLVYDPANQRVVLLGGSARMIDHDLPADVQMNWWLTADAWAYDVGDNTWTQLVPEQAPLVMAGTYRPREHDALLP